MADLNVYGMNPRQLKLARKAQLWNERSSWEHRWREVAQFQQPFASRFIRTDNNRGDARDSNVLDETAIFSADTLAAGFMSGATSPARPWSRFKLLDRDLMEYKPVKAWLFRVNELVRDIFAAGNTYNALRMGYEELGLFGTWANVMSKDFDNVIHHHPLTVGEYALATDAKNKVNTMMRELRMTVAQCAGEFGRENCSNTIKHLYDRGNHFAYVDVVHIIESREQREYGKVDNANMPWSDCYFEPACDTGHDKYLRESGHKKFPVLAPRWATRGRDVYGRGPGMTVRGSVKQLMQEQLRKGQAIDFQTDPPLQVPTAMRDQPQVRLPGGRFYVDQATPGGGVRTAYDVRLDLSHLLADIEDVRARIRRGYYTDLFLMLANDTRSGTTATEVAQRHEEKLLMLGPVLENVHHECLSPLIENTFDAIVEAGMLTGNLEPPKELQGQELQIEFISVLAQAQRMVAAGGVDRLLGSVGTIAAQKQDPSVWDKIDTDQVTDDYGNMFGVNPEIIRDDDEVARIRGDRAKQQQAQQTLANTQAVADSANKLAGADTGGQNALTDIMNQVQGYSTPAGAGA